MKSLLLKYRYHLLLVTIGLLWITLFDFLSQMSIQGIVYPDSGSYVESAKNLYVFYRGHNFRPILMALINGIPYLFGGNDSTVLHFSFYVNLCCWLALLLLLFELLKSFVRARMAFLFTLLAMTIIGNTALIFHLLTENIYMLFILLGFYGIKSYLEQKNYRFLALALSVFVLSMLIKPGSKFLAILLLVYFGKEVLKNLKSKYSLVLYAAVGMVLLQCAGLKYQFGSFTVSYIDSVTYYNYLGSKAECVKYGKEYSQMNNPRAEYLFSLDTEQQKSLAAEDLKQQLQYNKVNLVKAYFLDVIENTKTGNTCIEDCRNKAHSTYFSFWNKLFLTLSKWQNRCFTLLAVLLSLYFLKQYKREEWGFLIAVYVGYIIATSGISCGQGDRFHLVTFPFVILLLVQFLTKIKVIKGA